MKSLNLCLSLALLISLAHAFYVPGIAPREFTRGSKIGEFDWRWCWHDKEKFLKSNFFLQKWKRWRWHRRELSCPTNTTRFSSVCRRMERFTTSRKTSVKSCEVRRKNSIRRALDWLFLVLGDRIVNTPYDVRMGDNVNCKLLCHSKSQPMNWDTQQSRKVSERIEHEYFVHLLVDNLPVATRIVNPDTMELQFEHGYRLGMVSKGEPYINNHLKFVLSYHMHSKWVINCAQECCGFLIRLHISEISSASSDSRSKHSPWTWTRSSLKAKSATSRTIQSLSEWIATDTLRSSSPTRWYGRNRKWSGHRDGIISSAWTTSKSIGLASSTAWLSFSSYRVSNLRTIEGMRWRHSRLFQAFSQWSWSEHFVATLPNTTLTTVSRTHSRRPAGN